MTAPDEPRVPTRIERGMERLVTPLQEFVRDQTVASGLLLICAVAALVLANSGWAAQYEAVRAETAGVHIGGWQLSMSVQHWINDGLMALFFFLLGLEIKRELLAGELRDARRARLVVMAALGGMIVPAAVFALASPRSAIDGWGVPMATDTAFAIGVLVLLKGRVPAALATFLIALAIIDDIGAVLVIALFYSHEIAAGPLAAAAGVFAVLVGFNLLGIRRPSLYLAVGAGLWYAVLCSGLHATIAGILIAVTVPARIKYSPHRFETRIARLMQRFRGQRREAEDILAAPEQHAIVEEVRRTARKASTPLQRWETALETPISLLILPLFALANAGVELRSGASLLGDPLVLAVALGQVIGKLCGITGFCWLGIRLGIGTLPSGITMAHIAGVGLVAGMGFTMSIFIATLAYAGDGAVLQTAKSGVLLGTAVAGLAGYVVLRLASGRGEPRANARE